MKKTLLKETIRNIRKNLMSWIAIAVVTMIGCGVYCGVFFYADSMELNAKEFLADVNYEDLDIVALQGISEEEIASILELDGVLDVEGTIEITDARIAFDGEEQEAGIFGAPDRIGISVLTSGREPSAENECALTDQNLRDYGIEIGDTIEVIPASSDLFSKILKNTEFTVTGTVQCPEDFQISEKVYVVLPLTAFDTDKMLGYYTNALVKADIPEDALPFSKTYSSALQEVSDALESKLAEIGKVDSSVRQQQAQEKLDKIKADADQELQDAKETIEEKEQEIKDGEELLQQIEAQANGDEDPFAEAEAQIEDGKNQIEEAENQLSSAKRQLSSAEADLRDKENSLRQMEAVMGPISESDNELNNAKKTLNAKRAEIARKEEELNGKKEELADAETELEEKKQEFAEAVEDLPQKKNELSEAKEKLSEAKDEYQKKEEEITTKISDIQKLIDDLKEASFLLMNCNTKGTTELYSQFVNVLRKLATIFVVIFVSIGVVVVLSTITILIDNQKKQIGAMKAFGFRNGEIISKYTVFGLSAVCFGMLLTIGLAWILERIVNRVLGGLFVIECNGFAFHVPTYLLLFLIEVLLASGAAALTTWYSAVRSSAIDLMSGATAKQKHGKKAKVTRTKSLFSRLIFRNIKNDLARVVCSVIIIGGSCLMMGTGFTLNFAFEAMMPLSAKEVTHYQLEINANTEEGKKQLDQAKQKLSEESISFAEMTKEGRMINVGDDAVYAYVTTAEPEVFSDYLECQDMERKKRYYADGEGILIPNRFAENLGVNEGDILFINDDNLFLHALTVDGIYRNYVGRDLYVSMEVYRSLFDKEPESNTLLVRTSNPDTLSATLSEEFPLLEISSTSELSPSLYSNRQLFLTLVLVMTTLSIVMSVFVLLNLVNIFVGRRKNEIIIMGVNGFSYRERIGYLLRETVVTTVMGLLLGVAMGCSLSDYLVRLVEGSDTMFRRGVTPEAWILACLIETGFALCINFVAFRRVKKYELTELTR